MLAEVTVVVGADVGCEVCVPRESMGAKWALEPEVWEEWGHRHLSVVAAVSLFAKSIVFDGVRPSGVVAFPTRIEFVKLV